MDNWNFTGKPDVPAWPKDAQGQDEKAVLLLSLIHISEPTRPY